MKKTVLSACAAIALAGSTNAQSFICVPGSFPKGDLDDRGDIALRDFNAFRECFAGPDEPPDPSGAILDADCLGTFDAEGDRDVDLADLQLFMNAFTGDCVGVGSCPLGSRLVHRDGSFDVPDADTFDPAEANAGDFRCTALVRDGCEHLECGPFGRCNGNLGIPICVCRPGYAGGNCEQCAVGYERNPSSGRCELGAECRERLCSGNGDCRENSFGDIVCGCDRGFEGEFCETGLDITPVILPPARIYVMGTDDSIQRGERRQICTRLIGPGTFERQLTWELDGPGRLDVDRTTACAEYFAPPDFGSLEPVIARIEWCSVGFRDHCTERVLTIVPRGGVPISGQSVSILKPFDDVMIRFMRHRCVGAAILGVNVFGKTVFLRGYGNLSGAPTTAEDYLEACNDRFDVSDFVPGIPLPEPAEVKWNTPIRIGSNTKAVAAAILRKAVKEHLGGGATDDDVEDEILCNDPAYLPLAVREILCAGEPPPIPLQSTTGLAPNCTGSNPCPLGGTCTPANSTAGTCTNCPAGLSGPECTVSATFCPDLTDAVDSRWSQVRLGHLLGHRAGIPRTVPSLTQIVLPNLFSLRDLTDEGDWENQEDLLTSTSGYPAGTFAAEFPDFPLANLQLGMDGYFVPRPTGLEAVLTRAGACMVYTPGTAPPAGFDNYSNTAFSFVGDIAQTLTGQSFASKDGRPGLHSGSLLEDFTTEDLGLPLPGQGTDEGIFLSQNAFRHRNPKEPVYRDWSGATNGFYGRSSDTKRPHCIWNNFFDFCDFDDWVDDDPRFSWDFEDTGVLTAYSGGEYDAPGSAGSFATEAAVYLRFMAKYWVGGQGTDPDYGQTRCPNGNCAWSSGHSHNGSVTGGYSFALQLGGPVWTNETCTANSDCGSYTACAGKSGAFTAEGFCLGGYCYKLNEYQLPEFAMCGAITDGDFENPRCYACRLPVGVDIFVAINQRGDGRCASGSPSCSTAYGYLKDFLLHAACNVSWPPNPYVIWPPVLADGGSGFGFVTGGLPQPGTFSQFDCCGNGVKEGDEACDDTDFGTTSCATYGFEMGDLLCNNSCFISTALCSGGTSLLPPGTYGACGAGDCTDPSDCEGDDAGFCLGGPCRRTEPNNESGKLEWDSTFHPDGNFRDQHGNLYYCENETGHGEMVCIDVNGWGVCKRCTNNVSETGTRVGCSCDTEDQCENGEPGLGCYGEDFGSGPGFCWDAQDGPPFWQCDEGACGMAPYFGDDEMYCEHYDGNNHATNARCMPWYACDGFETQACAEQDLICAETQQPCMGDFPCCANECLFDLHCSEAFGWPPGYGCSPQLKCVYEP